jgi:hypothetical protein
VPAQAQLPQGRRGREGRDGRNQDWSRNDNGDGRGFKIRPPEVGCSTASEDSCATINGGCRGAGLGARVPRMVA